ncbi:hypothetical protein RND81_07G010800 [Saponaria officinalis]|uniref:Uncharacterized protein n=1 Tax=Saponaria officinalis TaxID=3572 RepID=A0AAW1JMG9_SAPOF
MTTPHPLLVGISRANDLFMIRFRQQIKRNEKSDVDFHLAKYFQDAQMTTERGTLMTYSDTKPIDPTTTTLHNKGHNIKLHTTRNTLFIEVDILKFKPLCSSYIKLFSTFKKPHPFMVGISRANDLLMIQYRQQINIEKLEKPCRLAPSNIFPKCAECNRMCK